MPLASRHGQPTTGAYKKDAERLFTRAPSGGRGDNGFNLKEGRFRKNIRKKCFYTECHETLALITQRSCRCLTSGSVQGQIEPVFVQSDPTKDVPAHGRRVGLNDI